MRSLAVLKFIYPKHQPKSKHSKHFSDYARLKLMFERGYQVYTFAHRDVKSGHNSIAVNEKFHTEYETHPIMPLKKETNLYSDRDTELLRKLNKTKDIFVKSFRKAGDYLECVS